MFDEFFRDVAPADIEELSSERGADIKAAVMKRVLQESEDKSMKKHNFFRPLLIAAAAVSVSAVSLVTANAATNGAVVDGITRMFTVIVNGEKISVEADYSEYDVDDMHIEQYQIEVPGSNGDETGISFVFAADEVESGETDMTVEVSGYTAIDTVENGYLVASALTAEEFDELIEKYNVTPVGNNIDISALTEDEIREIIENYNVSDVDVVLSEEFTESNSGIRVYTDSEGVRIDGLNCVAINAG